MSTVLPDGWSPVSDSPTSPSIDKPQLPQGWSIAEGANPATNASVKAALPQGWSLSESAESPTPVLPQSAAAPNPSGAATFSQIDSAAANQSKSVPAAAPAPPNLTAYQEPGLITRSLTRLRESLSPLIGETRSQTLRREQQNLAFSKMFPQIAAAASSPGGDKLIREGFVPALVNSVFTPAPGTPQLKMKNADSAASKASQITTGAFNVGANILNSVASPGGVALMIGGAPAKIAGMVLAPILAKHAAENAMPTLGVLRDPNASLQAKTEAALGETLSAVGAIAGARSAMKSSAGGNPAPPETAPSPLVPTFKSARDSASVFEGTAPAPRPTVTPSTAIESAGVFLPKILADKANGEIANEDYLQNGDKLPKMSSQAQRMMDQYGRIDPSTLAALARTGVGAAVGYYSGETPEEKIRNATIGGLAALGAPKVLRLLRGEPDSLTDAAIQDASPKGSKAEPPNPASSAAPATAPVTAPGGTGIFKNRGFVDHVQDSPFVSSQAKDLVSGIYETKTRAGVQAFAQNLVDSLVQQHPENGLGQAKAAFLSSADSPTAESWALGLELMKRFREAKDFSQEADVASHIASQATTPARALNMLGSLDRMSPEGIGLYVAKQAKEAGVLFGGKFGPNVMSRIRQMQADAASASTPETKLARQAELFEYINDQVPVPIGQKLARGLPLALIMHTKVFVTKALGDTSQMVLRTAADNVVPAFDKAFSVMTGTGRTRSWVSAADQMRGLGQPITDFQSGFGEARAQGEPMWPSVAAGAKTMATLARLATRSSYLDNNTADISTALKHTYSSRIGRGLEDLVSTGMGLPTRAAYMRAFKSRMANEIKTANLNGAELVTPSTDMVDRAHLAGMEATFSHENPFSKALSGSRKILNFGQPIGIGSAIAPLTKVPGGMVDQAVRYSPLGFVRAAYKGGLAKVLGNPEAVDRGAAMDAFTQASLGTTGLMGTGWWLAKNGVIRGAPEENSDAEAVRRAAGLGAYSVNLSALKRMMVTGKWDTPDRGQPGDITMPYNWSQPVGLGLAMGAETWHQSEEAQRAQVRKGLPARAGSLALGLLGTSRSLEDMNLFQGMSRLGKDVGSYGLLSGLGMQALNLPGMYVPAMFRDARNFQDNTTRQLEVSDKIQSATNRFLERIPVVADRMGFPAMRNRFGDAINRYDVGSNGWANVLLNPTYFSTLKADPAGKEVLRLWQNTGDQSALPKAVPMSMEIRDASGTKSDVALTPQQISDMQHWEGTLTRGFYLQLMHNANYVRLPDDQKAKYLGQIQSAVHGAAKMVLLGDTPIDADKRPRKPSELEQVVMTAAQQSSDLAGITKAARVIQSMKGIQR